MKRVLLVDDDEVTNYINKALVNLYLNIESIEIARNGKEALEILDNCLEQCPEIIFLDINMPIMDGFGFLENYKQMEFCNKSEVKTIILTTSNHPKDHEKLKEYDNIYFLNKPLTKEKLSSLEEIL